MTTTTSNIHSEQNNNRIFWLLFRKGADFRLGRFKERATLGSAMSNTYSIADRSLHTLQGQFTESTTEAVTYRDFLTKIVTSLKENDAPFKVGSWTVEVKTEAALHVAMVEEFHEAFKTLLKNHTGVSDPSQALKLFEAKYFLATSIPEEIKNRLKGVMAELQLYGPIEALLAENDVTDIMVESYNKIWVEKAGELILSKSQFTTAESYEVYIENLLSTMHKTVDESQPYVDFNLPDGSRGHLIGPPVTSEGHRYLSIRKIRKDFFTLESLLEREMFTDDQYAELIALIKDRKNILVSGATGSGKTTVIKALIHRFPISERVLVIEDTPELTLPRENTAFLCTRMDARGVLPPVSLRVLVKQALRMRPDRILIGEVRGEEALDLLHAMNTGHRGCMGSLHANSARDAIHRFQGLVQMSSVSLSEPVTWDMIQRNIHAVLHVGKDDKGKRRLKEIVYVEDILDELNAAHGTQKKQEEQEIEILEELENEENVSEPQNAECA